MKRILFTLCVPVFAATPYVTLTADFTNHYDATSPVTHFYAARAIALYDSGKVTTEGDSSHGLSALSNYAGVLISSTADIATSGAGSDGIRAQGKTRAEVNAAGTISTQGAGSAGISGAAT